MPIHEYGYEIAERLSRLKKENKNIKNYLNSEKAVNKAKEDVLILYDIINNITNEIEYIEVNMLHEKGNINDDFIVSVLGVWLVIKWNMKSINTLEGSYLSATLWDSNPTNVKQRHNYSPKRPLIDSRWKFISNGEGKKAHWVREESTEPYSCEHLAKILISTVLFIAENIEKNTGI